MKTATEQLEALRRQLADAEERLERHRNENVIDGAAIAATAFTVETLQNRIVRLTAEAEAEAQLARTAQQQQAYEAMLEAEQRFKELYSSSGVSEALVQLIAALRPVADEVRTQSYRATRSERTRHIVLGVMSDMRWLESELKRLRHAKL